MKRCMLVLGCSLLTAVPLTAGDDLAGTWALKTSFEWLPDLECAFKQAGAELNGTCATSQRALDVAAGRVDADAVTWRLDAAGSAPNGATVSYSFSGALDPNRAVVKGTVTAFDHSGSFPSRQGTFSASKR